MMRFALFFLLLSCPVTAHAISPAIPDASSELPPMPSMTPPSMFPALPPSRACVRKDLQGTWKLQNVYEEQVGTETADFQNNPVQYLSFENDNIYAQIRAGRSDLSTTAIQDAVKSARGKDLSQYLMHESGMLYFYKNGVAAETRACFIVASDAGNFRAGQLLLMPPQGQHPGRMVKVYAKIWEPAEKPEKEKKKRRKRRR